MALFVAAVFKFLVIITDAMKLLFSILIILSLCVIGSCVFSCDKLKADSYIPQSYDDGIFSINYSGQYREYIESGIMKGYHGCSAFAMYHSNSSSDTLIICGGTKYNKKTMRVLFFVPFELVNPYTGIAYLNSDMISFYSEKNPKLTAKRATLFFGSFFEGDEYVEGRFQLTMETNERIDDGLFRLRPKPYSGDFCNIWPANVPYYSKDW